jgi:hypothetical protein
MKFSIHPILLTSFVLATLTMAMPTPQPYEPEVREYHSDKLGARAVEDGTLVQRASNPGKAIGDVAGFIL